jgi:hypothetical protein
MPVSDQHDIGHKFPFNACEILTSDSGFILDKLFASFDHNDDEDSEEEEEEEEDDKRKDSGEYSEEKDHEKVENNEENDTVNYLDEKESEKADIVFVDSVTVDLTGVMTVDLTGDVTDDLNYIEKHEDEITTEEASKHEENKENIEDASIFKQETNVEDTKEIKEDDTVKVPDNHDIDKEETDDNVEIAFVPDTEDNSENKTKHKKTQSQTHEMFKEDEEEDIFNISSDNLQHSEKIESQSKDVKMKFELIDYFLNFLNDREQELNYVLAGYFYKIFNHLLTQKSQTFIKYLFTTKLEVLENLVFHTNRKSIAECLVRILLFQTEEVANSAEIKLSIIEKILNELEITKDVEKVENLTYVLFECFSNKNFFLICLKNRSLFKILQTTACKQIKPKEMLKVLVKFNENILKEFGQSVTPPFVKEIEFPNFNNIEMMEDINENPQNTNQIELFDIKEHIESIVESLSLSMIKFATDFTSTNQVKSFSSTYNKEQKILGTQKLTEFEYVKSVFEIIINCYAQNLCVEKLNEISENLLKTDFFNQCLKLFYEFPLNNIYQKHFEHLIMIMVNSHTPEILIKGIFLGESSILRNLIKKFEKEITFNFE